MAKKKSKSDKASLKERMRKKKKQLSTKGGKGNIIYLKEGTLRVRPMFCGDDNEFVSEVTQHYLGAKVKGVYSPTTIGDPCAINERYLELKESDDESDKDIAKKLVPKQKYLMPVIVYTDDKGKKVDEEKGIRFVQLTNGLYQEIIDLFLDDEWGDFTDHEDGYDLKLTRSGTGMQDTTYSVNPCKNTPTPKKYRKEIDLDEMLKGIIPTYEETEEKLSEFLHESPSDDDDEKASNKKKKKKKKSKDI